ncbi:FliH/SctL family protein [Serratia quinivorans]|uniref:hypothetical protein n=1 Tax=Serratia quinivorans TaxID=137545 RepID=UPI00217BCFA0|nr:hypothetical protein [Serratia quinivorans]CAI1009447.1 type III secretion apparatus protein, HrpE/YscL family [Serratia quinivorans]CAI1809892.1 type III secretion apparatus protein, HrpE/YscL family [Serratia quinivorans]
MNHYPFSIIEWDQPLGASNLISADELARLQQVEDIIQSARGRAAHYLRLAREQRREMRRRTRRQQAQFHHSARRRRRQHFHQAEQAGTQAALVWLVDQQQWQFQVYQRLMTGITRQLAQRLHQLVADLPWQQLLATQVKQLMDEYPHNHRLNLQVSPLMYDDLRAQLNHLPLTLVADVALAPGQAVLSSDLVQVRLNLPQQLALLCDKVAESGWETLHEPD